MADERNTLDQPPGAFKGRCLVKASKRWNKTGIKLEQGHKYLFWADSKARWLDWHTECGPEGYNSFKLQYWECLRRIRHARWFNLIGTLDRCARHPMIFKHGAKHVAHKRGELFFFANDVWFMYWNNHGEIEVDVYEVDSRL